MRQIHGRQAKWYGAVLASLLGCSNINTVFAAEGRAPVGLFVSSGPTISDRVLSMPHVAGNLIRVGWDDIEPQPGKYDFSAIDTLIQQAKKHDKRVALSILNGPRAPSWLYEQGVKAFTYEFKTRYSGRGDRQEIIPLPWDPVYLKYWQALIIELGARYDSETAIALVHVTHSSKNGFEMQLPESRTSGQRETAERGPWATAGYDTEKHINALKQIITTYTEAFSRTPLDIEIHPVLDSLAPAKAAYQHGKQLAGPRFGLFSAWWSGKSQPWNESMYPLLRQACEESFCTLQLIGNQSRQPERLAGGSVQTAIEVGKKLGARYFEVWDVDMRNRQLTGSLSAIAEQLEK